MILKFKIEKESSIKEYLTGTITARLLKVLSQNPNSFVVNNQIVKNYYVLKENDLLEVVIPVIDSSHIIPVNKSFEILYEDEYLLIINKEKDLATIPTRNHYTNSLANRVRAYYLQKGIASGIHFVNRLDAATSGIVVVAKNIYIVECMKKSILEKKYLLKVHGILVKNGTIKTNISKQAESIIKREVSSGDNAITKYKVLKQRDDSTLIEALLVTGKTHQLRVHFSSIGHAILGDKLYGNDEYAFLHLHSYLLKFIHPITKKEIELSSIPSWYSLEPHL